MTSRVYQCERQLITPRPDPRPVDAASPPARGFARATLLAAVLVPLSGAAEPPQGWTAAALAAVGVLMTLRLAGARAPWGGLALLWAGLGIALPRGPYPAVGPALFVATALCTALWLINRRPRRMIDVRPALGSRERTAQQLIGLSGERYVADVLARDLPDAFALINSLTLPRAAGDIDHVVVGPTGVFLLETKTMAGYIECDPDGTWRRTRTGRGGGAYAAYIGNPAHQVQRNIFAARTCLRERVPRLFQGTPLWLEGLVVFAHPRTDLNAAHSRVPAVLVDEAVAYICEHRPRRTLQAADVDGVVDALLAEGQARGPRPVGVSQTAQGLVEFALAVPLVIGVMFGTVAVARVVHTQGAVMAIAHEAARAAALGSTADDAVDRLQRRVADVAPGLGLDTRAVTCTWDVSTFGAEPGRVVVRIESTVDLRDLPLVGWAPVPAVHAQHVEWVDPFRSGLAGRTVATP